MRNDAPRMVVDSPLHRAMALSEIDIKDTTPERVAHDFWFNVSTLYDCIWRFQPTLHSSSITTGAWPCMTGQEEGNFVDSAAAPLSLLVDKDIQADMLLEHDEYRGGVSPIGRGKVVEVR